MSLVLKRGISSSPYGRTHVWKRRKPKLPNPVVPTFPQRVTLADGSTFTQWTTSPRSAIKLTRDTTNNPLWNSNIKTKDGALAGEEESTQMSRYEERFSKIRVSTSLLQNSTAGNRSQEQAAKIAEAVATGEDPAKPQAKGSKK